MVIKKSKQSLFQFDNYREFLKYWLNQAKENKTSNLTRLAESMNIHPTYLSHVLGGTKNLSAEQAFLVCEYFSLTNLERDYFFILVQIEKAGSVNLKNYLLQKKNELILQKDQLNKRFESHRELNDEERANYYASWLQSAVAVATDIENGQTAEQLSYKLKVDRDKIQHVLDFLSSVGIIKEIAGIYSLGEIHVHVPNESPFVVKHHLNWRMKAIQNMDYRTNQELFFTAPMSISEKDFEKLRELLNLTIQQVISIAKDSKSEKVVCLNIDYFKVTK